MFDSDIEKLRWFMLPSEAQNLLLGNCHSVKTTAPFLAGEYNGTSNNSLSRSESLSDPIRLTPNKGLLNPISTMYCRHNSLTSFETLRKSPRYADFPPHNSFGEWFALDFKNMRYIRVL